MDRALDKQHLARCLITGLLGIGAVSMAVFGTVAFAERPLVRALTPLGAYLFWALLFMVGGGFILSTLLPATMSRLRFVGYFAAGFFLYSAAYVAFYFPLKNLAGEWLGIGFGSVGLAAVLAAYFKNWTAFPVMALALLIANVAGYGTGRLLWTIVPPPNGMLLWGLLYGTDLGAGLGMAIYLATKSSPNSER